MGIEKIILGIILVVIGLILILPVTWCQSVSLPCLGMWYDLWLVLKGVIPAFLMFIGAILVWIESEELKIERPKRRR